MPLLTLARALRQRYQPAKNLAATRHNIIRRHTLTRPPEQIYFPFARKPRMDKHANLRNDPNALQTLRGSDTRQSPTKDRVIPAGMREQIAVADEARQLDRSIPHSWKWNLASEFGGNAATSEHGRAMSRFASRDRFAKETYDVSLRALKRPLALASSDWQVQEYIRRMLEPGYRGTQSTGVFDDYDVPSHFASAVGSDRLRVLTPRMFAHRKLLGLVERPSKKGSLSAQLVRAHTPLAHEKKGLAAGASGGDTQIPAVKSSGGLVRMLGESEMKQYIKAPKPRRRVVFQHYKQSWIGAFRPAKVRHAEWGKWKAAEEAKTRIG